MRVAQPLTIHQRPVLAGKIVDPESSVTEFDARMLTRHAPVDQMDQVFRQPANRSTRHANFKDRALGRTRGGLESNRGRTRRLAPQDDRRTLSGGRCLLAFRGFVAFAALWPRRI